ncbi:MAG: TonB-dependent receptor [candidate division Zixibacteria bacterium]|nr:TonB-dependent receptor [candidate division Zixibacteria bacterium]
MTRIMIFKCMKSALLILVTFIAFTGLISNLYGFDNPYIGEKIPRSLHSIISLDLNEVTLEQALKEISEKGGFELNYNRNRIPLDNRVTVVTSETKAIEALAVVLDQSDAGLHFTEEGQIVVVPSSVKDNKGSITGKISDAENEEALLGASIELLGYRRGAVSDIQGTFIIPDVNPGAYNLKIRCIGYETKILENVQIGDSETANLDVPLVRQPIQLKEIVVTPGTFAIMESETSVRQSLTREDIETVSQLGEDIYRAVNRLPGIASNDYSSQLRIRGGEHNEILVLLDGMELYEPFHVKDVNDGLISIIDAEAVEGIDLMTGGFTADYGNRLSGVFNIKTKKPNQKIKSYSLGASLMNLRFMTEGTFKDNKGNWFLSARRGYLDIVLKLMGEDEAPSPKYYDILGKIERQLNSRQTLSLSVLHADDEMSESDERGLYNFASSYGNSYAWLTLKSLISTRLYVHSIFSVGQIIKNKDGFDRFSVERFPSKFEMSEKRKFDMAGIKQDWQYELTDNIYLKWGAEYKSFSSECGYDSYQALSEYDQSGFNIYDSISTHITADVDGYAVSGYLSNRFKILDPVAIELGIRYDKSSYSKDEDVSPRANGMFKLGPKTFLRWGWGKFYQPQAIHELDAVDGVATYGRSELSEHWTAGFEHTLPKGIQLRVEAYHKEYSRLRPSYRNWEKGIELVPEVEYERIEVVLDSRIAKGLEIFAKKDVGGKFSFSASYALAYADEEIDHINFREGTTPIPYNRSTPSPNDQRHTIGWDMNYRPGDDWTLNVSWSYHSGWPYTGYIARHVDDTTGNYYTIENTRYNALNFPAYHKLNLRATKRFNTKKGQYKLFLELINLYNHDNIYNYNLESFTVDRNGVPHLGYEEEHWFHLLPSIGLSWNGNF